jgi:hypothetical protein
MDSKKPIIRDNIIKRGSLNEIMGYTFHDIVIERHRGSNLNFSREKMTMIIASDLISIEHHGLTILN